MNAFYTTVQIVFGMFGILSPFIVFGLIYLLIGLVSYLKTISEHYANEARKKPPYDEIESSVNALNIQLVRKGKVVFEDKVPRTELEGSKEQ